jgi:branched-chain amino acid transport system substrate-binding protein
MILRAISTLALLLVALWPRTGLCQISDELVKLGVLTDLSGPASDATGQGSVVAAQMAVEDFGGKVLGKPILR